MINPVSKKQYHITKASAIFNTQNVRKTIPQKLENGNYTEGLKSPVFIENFANLQND